MAKQKLGSWPDADGRAERDAEHLKALETTPPKGAIRIELPKLDIRTLEVRIVGDSELICHKWSKKAIKQIIDKQMMVAGEGKEPKDPVHDYRESLYVMSEADPFEDGVFGFPTIAFKNAAVDACTSLGKSITKVQARQAFHMIGEYVVIEGRPRMREDMVRVGPSKSADVRYRGGFPEWGCNLRVRFNARVLSAEQIVNLLNIAGFAVGVGEWRSEKDGQFGLFRVQID
jgi:hypothetical protein